MAVVKNFEEQPTVVARPIDRMLALWSHLVTRLEGAQNTINLTLGGHKSGNRVLDKMWMIQATFFTMKCGHFTEHWETRSQQSPQEIAGGGQASTC